MTSLKKYVSRWGVFFIKLLPPAIIFLAAFNTPALGFEKGIQIDPGFPYYQGRSEESIAEEIKLNDYTIVHYFITNENNINVKLVEELKKAGLEVWALVLGNGTYSTANFPSDWPNWQMKHLVKNYPGFTFFCMNNQDYREWKKASLAKVIQIAPFDGVELAESYLPEINGFSSGAYACLCDHCLEIFQTKFDEEPLNFKKVSDPRYYRKNKEAYEKWIQFRVFTVNDFLNDIVNGPNGLRENRPDILVSTWSLGLNEGSNSVARIKEMQGLEAVSLVETVKPDRHTIQTHWPDWVREDLPANYIKGYEAFAAPLKERFPELPLMLQTDIGSQTQMRRSNIWLEEFYQCAEELGYQSVMSYEYHLGLSMYTQAPSLKDIKRLTNNRIQLSFDKRIDSLRATDTSIYEVVGFEEAYVSLALVDGNRLILLVSGVDDSEAFDLEIGEIYNTPNLFLFKNSPAQANLVGKVHIPPLNN